MNKLCLVLVLLATAPVLRARAEPAAGEPGAAALAELDAASPKPPGEPTAAPALPPAAAPAPGPPRSEKPPVPLDPGVFRNVSKAEAHRLAELEQAQAEFSAALQAQAQGQLDTAAAAYKRALQIDPGFVEALVNLARVRAEQGHVEEARTLLAQAQAARPDYPEIYVALGWLDARGGNTSRARSELEHAIELAPTQVGARINLAALLVQHGSLPRAIDLLQSALALDPENTAAMLDLGLAYDRSGDPAHAEYYYAVFLARSPSDDTARAGVQDRLAQLERSAQSALAAAHEQASKPAPQPRGLKSRGATPKTPSGRPTHAETVRP